MEGLSLQKVIDKLLGMLVVACELFQNDRSLDLTKWYGMCSI